MATRAKLHRGHSRTETHLKKTLQTTSQHQQYHSQVWLTEDELRTVH